MIGREVATFLVAVQFLTRVPVPGWAYSPERLRAAARYYPLVGALVGAAAAGAALLGGLVWPPVVAILVSTGSAMLLTGAFHEDGLADTFDGIGGGATRERALAIMKDSRIGTYGALALVIAVAIKVAALASLPWGWVAVALVAGHGLSRLSAVLVIATGRYARDEGTSKFTADGVARADLAVALATGLALVVLLWVTAGVGVVAALAGLVAGHLGARAVFERKLGGYTGDCLGAVQQVSEVGLYLGLLAWA